MSKNLERRPWGGGGPRKVLGAVARNRPGPNPPDLEDSIRRGQDRLCEHHRAGAVPGSTMACIDCRCRRAGRGRLAAALGFTAFSRTSRRGAALRQVHRGPRILGLNSTRPHLIETVPTLKGSRVNRETDIGIQLRRRSAAAAPRCETGWREPMITGDEEHRRCRFRCGVLDAEARQRRARPLMSRRRTTLFNVQNPEGEGMLVARARCARGWDAPTSSPIRLVPARPMESGDVHDLMQRTLDDLPVGHLVLQVQI